MALAHWQRTLTDTAGNIQSGISVTIRNESSGALAAIFTDSAGGTPKANPFTTDSFGYGDFYAADGRYRIQATGIDWRNEEVITFENIAAAVQDAEDAAQAAALNAGIYADTTEGLANTVDGDYFSTPAAGAEEYLTLYRNDAGVATEIDTYPNKTAIDNVRIDLASNLSTEGSDLVAHTGTDDTVTEALGKRAVYVASVAEDITNLTGVDGSSYYVTEWQPNTLKGGHLLIFDSSAAKSGHGVSGWSPTVPAVSTQAGATFEDRRDAYLAATGETDPGGTGLFVINSDEPKRQSWYGGSLEYAIAAGAYIDTDDTTVLSEIVLDQETTIAGQGYKTTVFTNGGSGRVFSTINDAGAAKDFAIYIRDVGVKGTDKTTPASSAVRFIDMGKCGMERVEFNGHESGLELEACVGFSGTDLTFQQHTNALFLNSPTNLEGVTYTSFDKMVATSNTNLLKVTGELRALHFNESDFETTDNLISADSTDPIRNLVFRNSWFEGFSNLNFEECTMPIMDTCYFSGDNASTGGVMPVFNNIHITPTTQFGIFTSNQETSEIRATTSRFNNTGSHGIKLTMPKIGHASTPVDVQYTQGVAQSMLFSDLGGTLHGYTQALENLIDNPVYQTAFVSGENYWPLGDATVTTGQEDMYGGTDGVLLDTGTLHGTTSFTTIAGEWYVMQVAFKMVSSGGTIELNPYSNGGGTLQKRNSYEVGDTEWRVAHCLFKADHTESRVYLRFPSSGVIVHRVGVYKGVKLRPFLKEGRNIDRPFIMEYDKIKIRGASTPIAGDWEVGDELVYPAPTAGGFIGEVCTASGSPGTWKTWGAITA